MITVNRFHEIDGWMLSTVNHEFLTNNCETFINLPIEFEKYSNIGFKSIATIPDGSCLIHSVILSLSPIYSKIQHQHRSNYGRLFRQQEFVKHTNQDPNNIMLVSSDSFLDDRHAGEIAKWLKIVIIMFDLTMARINHMHNTDLPALHVIGLEQNTSDETPVIFILGSGMHFESMVINNRPTLSLKDARTITEICDFLKF